MKVFFEYNYNKKIIINEKSMSHASMNHSRMVLKN